MPDPVEEFVLIEDFHAEHSCTDPHELLLGKDGIFTGDVLFLGGPAEPPAMTGTLLVLLPSGVLHAAYPAGDPSGKAVGRVQFLSAPGVCSVFDAFRRPQCLFFIGVSLAWTIMSIIPLHENSMAYPVKDKNK